MKKLTRTLAGLTTLAAFTSPVLSFGSANVQVYQSAANSTYTVTEDAIGQFMPSDPFKERKFYLSTHFNWVNDPLVEYDATHTVRTQTLVDSISTLELGGGLYLNKRLSLFAYLPVNSVNLITSGYRFGFGDARFLIKYRVTDDDAFIAVSVIPEIWMPTGDASLFLTDGSIGLGAKLAFEHEFGKGGTRLALNVGYRYTPDGQYLDLNYSNRVPLALGLFVPFTRQWGGNLEVTGSLVLPGNSVNNPGEAYAGLRYQPFRDVAFLAGASLGAFNNASAGADIRASGGLRFSPMPDPTMAPAPTPRPSPSPVPVKRVIFTPKEIKILEEVKFEHDKAVLTASGKQLLDEVAEVIKANRKSFRQISIEGHTNKLGSYKHNMVLSAARAASVKEYLMSRGVEGKPLLTSGYGYTRPKKVPGLSKAAQLEANRRVEFRVIK
jgi:outer membrane protein OmpA-like peptidoglycan-associated protein